MVNPRRLRTFYNIRVLIRFWWNGTNAMTQQFETHWILNQAIRMRLKSTSVDLCVLCVMFDALWNQANYEGFGTICKLSLSLLYTGKLYHITYPYIALFCTPTACSGRLNAGVSTVVFQYSNTSHLKI